jgi:hypothetical protein
MRYNDEWILYTQSEIKKADVGKYIRAAMFDDPRVVVSRPVFDVEVREGLEVKAKPISSFDEKVPDITKFLDDVFELKDFVSHFKQHRVERPEWDFVHFLVNHFSSAYYDCMAGGVSAYMMSLLSEVAKIGNMDLSEVVYNGMEKDYTLGDILKGEKWPDLTPFLHKIQNQIPSVGLFLLE